MQLIDVILPQMGKIYYSQMQNELSKSCCIGKVKNADKYINPNV